MNDELRKLADLFYMRIAGPNTGVNIRWLYGVMRALKVEDENIAQLNRINAPLSREVWYYALLQMYNVRKLADFLNLLIERFGAVELGNLKESLPELSLEYSEYRFTRKTFKIAVLVSGRGTNLQAIIDAVQTGKINAEIVAVLSNRKNAYALERAKKAGIETFYVPARKDESREDYDKRLHAVLAQKNPDLVVLAGFLRILSPWFVKQYQWRIINIHPSLLPAFGGLYGEAVHKAVLEHGCKVTGCTVHFVDEKVDHGPIIVQKCVPVKEGDTVETLSARVLEAEHLAMVEAIGLIADGRVKVKGGIAHISHDID